MSKEIRKGGRKEKKERIILKTLMVKKKGEFYEEKILTK